MIRVLRKKRGELVKGSLKDLSKKAVDWIDCINPSPDEIKALSKKLSVPASRLRKYMGEEARPHVHIDKKFSAIIFNVPLVTKEDIEKTSLTIFITEKNDILTLRKHKLDSIKRLEKDIKEDIEIIKKPGMFVYRLLQQNVSEYFLLLEQIDDRIDKLEEVVVKEPSKIHVNTIFALKKSLIYFHKALTANREVIMTIEKGQVPGIQKSDLSHFLYIYNDIIQLIDIEETYREIITGVLEMYLSQVSNNLNIVMKRLTSWASLILIPTLIASIYGMNFKNSPLNMPELSWQYGYFMALGIMVVSVVGLYFYFRKKNWL